MDYKIKQVLRIVSAITLVFILSDVKTFAQAIVSCKTRKSLLMSFCVDWFCLAAPSKFALAKVAPVEAVLFDVDGTLCDSDPLHLVAFREMLIEVHHVYAHSLCTFFPNFSSVTLIPKTILMNLN